MPRIRAAVAGLLAAVGLLSLSATTASAAPAPSTARCEPATAAAPPSPTTAAAQNPIQVSTHVTEHDTFFSASAPPAVLQNHFDAGVQSHVTYRADLVLKDDPCLGPGKKRVTKCTVDATLSLTAFLPKPTPPQLLAHERGHVKLATELFNALAKKKYAEACAAVLGKSFSSKSQALKALTSSLNDATAALVRVIDEAGARFDDPDVTNHGRNASPTPDEAVDLVFDQFVSQSP